MANKAFLSELFGLCSVWRNFDFLKIFHNLLIARLCREANLEAHAVSFGQLGRNLGQRNLLFVFPNVGVLHSFVQNRLVDGNSAVVEVLLVAKDLALA